MINGHPELPIKRKLRVKTIAEIPFLSGLRTVSFSSPFFAADFPDADFFDSEHLSRSSRSDNVIGSKGAQHMPRMKESKKRVTGQKIKLFNVEDNQDILDVIDIFSIRPLLLKFTP
jgi:hypothetical protein